MTAPSRLRIVEVGPRDGLQNESATLTVDLRVALITALADAGVSEIEAGSFVSPKWVPQMAQTDEVMAQVPRRAGLRYTVLAPNARGLEGAIAAKADDVAVFAAASESFSRKNINCSIAESIERFRPVAEGALAAGMTVRGYISCVLGCPYEGEVPVAKVVEVAEALVGLGAREVSLGDTIGVGTPARARALAAAVGEAIGIDRVALHFHDTWGQALANLYACLDLGIAAIDSSVAGLGGCPYARGATGNVATEDVVYMLDGLGIATGIDLDRLAAAGRMISRRLGRAPASRAAAALAARLENAS